jgi:hypothetical protein
MAGMSSRRIPPFRPAAANLALALGSLLALLSLAELVLRLLPVRTSLVPMDYDARPGQIFRLVPGQRYRYSSGALLSRSHRGRINNFGFANDADYDSASTAPLLAVIGDSYVEALVTPTESTMQRYLASDTRTGRVYSFGMRGAPLSQYVAYAGYVRHTFNPTSLVVVIVDNDFDASLDRYYAVAGFCHYGIQADSTLALYCLPYRESTTRRLLRQSALVRYLVLNAQVQFGSAWLTRVLRIDRNVSDANAASASAPADRDWERVFWSKRAVGRFLRDIADSSGLPPERIALVVDAVRPAIYQSTDTSSRGDTFVGAMRAHLADLARSRGFIVIDLNQAFQAEYLSHGKRLEYGSDPHWNGTAHLLAARAVEASPVWLTFQQGERSPIIPK